MDFSKFSNDNFDVKEWINNALRIQKDTSITIDSHTSNLVMKLQLFIQEVNKSLEETSNVALGNIPRVLREIEAIKTEASLLHRQMQLVKEDIRTVEENTAHSMKRLVEVDHVKSRMQDAANALQEADNWSTLSSEVNQVFATENVDQIADKLIGMQKSLRQYLVPYYTSQIHRETSSPFPRKTWKIMQVLQDVPDYAERYRLLENLKNKLEATLSTHLVTTFNSHDLGSAKEYVRIFSELDRLDQLQTYYNNCHKASLMSTWNEIRDDPSQTIVSWLPTFFDNLLALWHREITWCSQVFPEPIKVLSALLSQTLHNLHPSIPDCISEVLRDGSTTKQLPVLIQLRQISSRFITGLLNAVKTFEGVPSTSDPAVMQLITVVQTPYIPYLLQYSELQETTLMDGLSSINLSCSNLSDTCESMVESVQLAFQFVEEAKVACSKFTEGFGAVGLLESLQVFFSAYFGKLDSLLVDLRKKCHLDRKVPSEPETSSDQWSDFQHAFKLIEMCGRLQLKLDEFRKSVTTEMKNMLKEITASSADAAALSSSYNYLKSSRPVDWDNVLELGERLQSYGVDAVLPAASELVQRLNEHAHKFAFDLIFVHLKKFLMEVPKMQVWSADEEEALGGELPTFSLSPQGYITQVGDSLLTLPQQLEPYFSQENAPLMKALEAGSVPFSDVTGDDASNFDVMWLNGLASGSCAIFVENILKIKCLTPHSSRQLAADIDYFCNILSALDIHPAEDLITIKQLVEVEKERYLEQADSVTVDACIIDAISKMRNITI